eukprot:264943-Prorocentrum_minimum.AAC.3
MEVEDDEDVFAVNGDWADEWAAPAKKKKPPKKTGGLFSCCFKGTSSDSDSQKRRKHDANINVEDTGKSMGGPPNNKAVVNQARRNVISTCIE